MCALRKCTNGDDVINRKSNPFDSVVAYEAIPRWHCATQLRVLTEGTGYFSLEGSKVRWLLEPSPNRLVFVSASRRLKHRM